MIHDESGLFDRKLHPYFFFHEKINKGPFHGPLPYYKKNLCISFQVTTSISSIRRANPIK
jgi:hypothetical protein